MTSNQQQISSDKASQRGVSERDTDVNAGARIQSANINAGAHVAGANIAAGAHPTQTGYLQTLIAKQNSGQALTPAEQQYFTNATTKARGGGIHLGVQPGGGVPISMAGAGNPVANSGKPVTPQQAASLPKGTHFMTSDGRWLVR